MPQPCPSCGAPVAEEDRACGSCGRVAAAAPVDGAAGPAVVSGGASLAQPRNLARVAQLVALLGFVLPWVTVSCQGRVLAEISGLEMALGRVTIHNPFTDVTQVHGGAPNLPVVIALVLVVGGLALSFNLRGVRSALANALGSAAALLLIAYEVLVATARAVRPQAASWQAASGLERSFAEAVRVGTGFGFWLTCLALAAAAYLYWRLGTGVDAGLGLAQAPPPPRPAEARSNAPVPPG